jgi:hypothetical protein
VLLPLLPRNDAAVTAAIILLALFQPAPPRCDWADALAVRLLLLLSNPRLIAAALGAKGCDCICVCGTAAAAAAVAN